MRAGAGPPAPFRSTGAVLGRPPPSAAYVRAERRPPPPEAALSHASGRHGSVAPLGPGLAGPVSLRGLVVLAFAVLTAAGAEAQRVTTLVSNTDQTLVSGSAEWPAQNFGTGAHRGGYEVTEIRLWIAGFLTGATGFGPSPRQDPGGQQWGSGRSRGDVVEPFELLAERFPRVHGAEQHPSGCEHDLLGNNQRGPVVHCHKLHDWLDSERQPVWRNRLDHRQRRPDATLANRRLVAAGIWILNADWSQGS